MDLVPNQFLFCAATCHLDINGLNSEIPSRSIGVSAGIPQGSILGSLLFNIFMNDLVYTIENSKMLNYADDTKIYLSHSERQIVEGGINRDLESARLWFKENGMMPNPKKYQAIVLKTVVSGTC